MKADFRIRNGRVIDPARNVDRVEDVLIAEGKIVDPAANAGMEAEQEIDASGCIVTPGLVDFHCHIFAPGSDLCVPPDLAQVPAGVTTAVDAGSAGTANIELFLSTMLTQRIRFKAFMHVCPNGLGTTQFHETVRPETWDRVKMLRLLEKHKDVILGLKVRYSKELVADEKPLRETIAMAEKAGVPVCVHTTNPPSSTEDLLDMLRPGDIFCHVMHGKGTTIIDNGKVKPAVYAAQKRGVIFDACNGVNHFSFDTAISALADGFLPDVISTDLSSKSLWRSPAAALPYIMSKYVALGCDLSWIIRATTCTPAKLMGMEGKIGTLAPGAFGDVSIFKLDERPVTFWDTFKKSHPGKSMLVPLMTISEGFMLYRNLFFM